MDRRQRKTRDSIFKAFSRLLENKAYEHITVQEIIDEADIGRSTFYAHFETKDMLLKEMCGNIFEHIFDGDVCDYDKDTSELESKLAHIMWHFHEIKSDVTGLISSQSGEIFMRYLKEYLSIFFEMYVSNFNVSVPDDFLLNHLVGSFCSTLTWWVKNDMQTTPEQTARYLMEITETHKYKSS